jgi:predicted permease
VGAGLFVRTLANLQSVNTGFNERNLLLFHFDPTQDGYKEQRLADFYQEFTRRLRALPGVRSVTLSSVSLIGGGVAIRGISIPGYISKVGEKKEKLRAWVNSVGASFFETMGIPIVLGRGIGEGDTATAPQVAVVNEQFVRKYLSSGSPIGRQCSLGTDRPDVEIVGVAGDAKFSDLRAEVPPTIYTPYLQEKFMSDMYFEVRTAGDPLALAPAVRRVSMSMDPNLALFDVKSQVEQIDQSLFQERLFARLTSVFGLLAALLGCVGVYGIMAFATSQRTREIGIRMALGASRNEILGMVLRETLILVAIGIMAGTLVALEASRLVSTFLYGVKANDPLTIAGAALLMVAAAALAGYLPARRASRVDPMVALRYE